MGLRHRTACELYRHAWDWIEAAMKVLWVSLMRGGFCLLGLTGHARAGALDRREVHPAAAGQVACRSVRLNLTEHLCRCIDQDVEIEMHHFQGRARSLQALIGSSIDVVAGAFAHNSVMQALAQKMMAFMLIAKNPGVSSGGVKSKLARCRSPLGLAFAERALAKHP